jgi:hypothetical protein
VAIRAFMRTYRSSAQKSQWMSGLVCWQQITFQADDRLRVSAEQPRPLRVSRFNSGRYFR